ncbi:hypothetical protein KPL78_00950 [Roseomonas sp. HJA6]|uniref:DUF927 domain-containing protein n=1 Tax=Roseomonas alba TaxID=2846776 RepID=A0ABS7A262_9PROT|nr:hypothetical protein [Neoroseomonas alba]MBW6396388.1 hypothetical protein [Neoroseomonas alba]
MSDDFITIIKSASPPRVCKSYRLDADGRVTKTAVAHVTEGTARTVVVPDADALVALLRQVTEREDEVICPGVFEYAGADPFRMVSEKRLFEMLGKKGDVPGGVQFVNSERVAARLKRGIAPSSWMLIDADNPPGMPEDWQAMPLADRLERLEAVVPGISTCERVELRGSSSRVVNGSGNPGPATHAWVHVSDASKIEMMRNSVHVAAVNAGLSFPSPHRSRTEPGREIGHGWRSLIDFSVWVTGRLVFCARPEACGEGMSVTDADVRIVNRGGGVLDISGIKLPDAQALDKYRKRTGARLRIERDGDRITATNEGDLTWETEIESRGAVKTLREWVAEMNPGDKLRCETPFRESRSEAAVLRQTAHGPVLFDAGTEITYRIHPADDAANKSKAKPDLLINGADLTETAKALGKLLSAQPHLFDRAGPVRVACDASAETMIVERLTPVGVINEAHAASRPYRVKVLRNGAEEDVYSTLPKDVAALYLDDRNAWGLRPLDGITSAPLLRDDGTIHAVEGYDPATRMWCRNVPVVDVPERPTRGEAEAALLRLRKHWRTFPFADSERVAVPGGGEPVVDTSKPPGMDESTFLVALLTAVCRPSLGLSVAVLVRAAEMSGAATGKGLLIRSMCAVAYGAQPAAVTAGSAVEEMEKRIAAVLVEARSAVILDNVNGAALKSDLLASALTERPAEMRVLGKSEMLKLNATTFISVTGNGVLLSEDLVRRFVVIELDAKTENPEAREFEGDFLAETMAARQVLLRDALTIWRWGRAQGRGLPRGKAASNFVQWERWCRDPLLALGCRDAMDRVAETKARDPERQRIEEFFAEWWMEIGPRPVLAADIMAHQSVRAVVDPIGRGQQYLVKVLGSKEGTIAGGFKLVRSKGGGTWGKSRYSLQWVGDGDPPPRERRM